MCKNSDNDYATILFDCCSHFAVYLSWGIIINCI